MRCSTSGSRFPRSLMRNWNGEAGPSPSYLDPESGGQKNAWTLRNTVFMTGTGCTWRGCSKMPAAFLPLATPPRTGTYVSRPTQTPTIASADQHRVAEFGRLERRTSFPVGDGSDGELAGLQAADQRVAVGLDVDVNGHDRDRLGDDSARGVAPGVVATYSIEVWGRVEGAVDDRDGGARTCRGTVSAQRSSAGSDGDHHRCTTGNC